MASVSQARTICAASPGESPAMHGVCRAYGSDLLRLPPAVLQQAHLVQGQGRDVLLGVLEACSSHPHAKGEAAMVGMFL